MKPLLLLVACLALTQALPENIEDVKELPQSKDPVIEAEESAPQERKERSFQLNLKSPFAKLQAAPGGEVHIHTQRTFEECSSDKGCAGLKVKDGKVVEKFGNIDAFKQAAAADASNEFTFHAGGLFGNVFEGGIPNNGPFWWMNQYSPFKAAAQGGNFESFSKSSSSFSSSGTTGAGAGGAGFGASIDLSGNPFLNGKISGQNSGFGGQNQAQGFSAQSQYSAGGNKFGSGYTGSSPSPFTAATGGSNVNLIQNSQKASEFEFEQQQQNIDEVFQGTGNVHAHEHSNGGELQQTCAGQGYVCVHKAQCNNGVVNTNGAGILQAKTKKQYCNIKTEICCRIEISTLAGAGGLQGSLGVGSATYSGQGSQQGGGLFVSTSQGGATGSGSSSNAANGASGTFGANGGAFGTGQNAFESSSSSFESSSTFGTASRGGANQGGVRGSGFGATGTGFNAQGGQGSSSFGSSSSTGFEAQGTFGSKSGSGTFGSQGSVGSVSGSGSTGFEVGSVNTGSTTGFGQGAVNRGVTVQESSSTFETRGTSFGNNAGTTGTAGVSGNKFGASGTFGTNFGATGSSPAPVQPNQFGTGNEVVYKQTSQSNFIETDTFAAGSENNAVYRPGAPGTVLKPGIPYLPPVDATISGSNQVSSTAFPTTRRPFTTPKPVYRPPVTTPVYRPPVTTPVYRPPVTTQAPTYLPPVTTRAPTYLPPQQPAQSINTETRVPTPTYSDGSLILDASRTTSRPFVPIPVNNDVTSGCAAALKCTPIEYCTADGVISNTTVALTREQDAYRVPLTDCKIIETGVIGKCCRDPYYTDPWPVNQLGQWLPNTFGGNDGKYTPDSRGSGSIASVKVTPGPFTGSTQLNAFSVKPTEAPAGLNQIGFQSSSQKSQFEIRGQGQAGQFGIGAQGQFGQGSQISTSQNYNRGSIKLDANRQAASQGQAVSQGFGQGVSQGFGQGVRQGQGQIVSQGFGQVVRQGQGQAVITGQGQAVQDQAFQGQAFGQGIRQGQAGIAGQNQQVGQGIPPGQGQTIISSSSQSVSESFVREGVNQGQGQGQAAFAGQGQAVSQGFGQGVRQGSGFAVSQGGGFSVENEYSVSEQRVFLQRYEADGQCGIMNGQKPYGNRNDNEVDFAEIPWQAMVLLQTNRSLLCGGVITRPDVVVTSASCVDGLEAKNVLIKGGEWKLGIDDEPLPYQIVQVKNILRHPYYKKGSLVNDVAILVLAENLRFAKNIYPICLPRADETLDAFYNGAGECIVTGWGKQVLQAHLQGSILHSLNISLVNPGECEARLSQDYPHLLSEYDRDSSACGLPSNPTNNICRVDIGSALACTTDNSHFVLRGIYSWDSGCQLGNQIAAFYKFDLEWYEWAIGLIESTRFAQFSSGSQILGQNRFAGQINSGLAQVSKGGFKGQIKAGGGQSAFAAGQSSFGSQASFGAGQSGFGSQASFGGGQSGFTSGQFGQFSAAGGKFSSEIKPITNSFSATYTEKKVYQSEPKIVTFTTKPEIVTFTTKPEYFTYTTKPKIVTYTTKPQFITYETSGSATNPQYVAPGVTFNPSFSEVVGKGHTHNAQCKCEGKK